MPERLRGLDPVATFLAWADDQPDHPAVVERNRTVSYAELAVQTRRLAAAIALEGGSPKVMVHLPQGADAYAAMFATLMAGAFYTPMNLEAPSARLETIRRHFAPDVLITTSTYLANIATLDAATRVVLVDALGEAELMDARRPADLAYVIFTSGSTGAPKGVMIPSEALRHYLAWAVPALGMTPEDRCSQHPNIGFDLSVIDIYATLCSGATLVPVVGLKYRLMPAEAVRDHALTTWVSVPSVVDLMSRARQVTSAHLGTLKRLFFCGEPLLREHLNVLFAALPDVTVFNAYGPTEATVSCTELRLKREDYAEHCDVSAAIGSAIPGMSLELVGGPDASEGELLISGPQLARGYWEDVERTAAAFRPTSEQGRIAYHTGDWAAVRGGNLYFLRRTDRQIKILGNRLELGDVDAALRQLGVEAAHTVFVNGRLVSFVEPFGGDTTSMLDGLSRLLPRYAVPAEVRVLDRLPRNQNDKVDARALEELA